MRLDAFDRYPLTFGPSPVHRLERLSAHLGGADVWAKRDDCNSGLAYGGNTVIVCSVTGSTQAGMIAGFAGQERARRVIGIDGSARPAETHAQVARIARATAALIEVGRELRDDEVVLDDRYHAGTYGIPDDTTLEAMRTAARLEGMITDPVYEGKSMAGLIDLVARGEIERGSNVLYAHLGGQPALSAYAAVVR
jgi:1-aminocyclopropane-1-carboxylate deaminase